jgi:hypothetical protein
MASDPGAELARRFPRTPDTTRVGASLSMSYFVGADVVSDPPFGKPFKPRLEPTPQRRASTRPRESRPRTQRRRGNSRARSPGRLAEDEPDLALRGAA